MKNKRIVLVGGCFDILHYGHIHFLRESKKLGDHLVVILESDDRIKKLKGVNRPIHDQNQRKEILESLHFVDEVIMLKDEMTDKDYEDIVKRINPHIIAITKGSKTKTHARLVNAEVVEVDKINDLSTTKIVSLLEEA
jgi:rfaE bifunctional protein nucleotidyltransferase chain/domain